MNRDRQPCTVTGDLTAGKASSYARFLEADFLGVSGCTSSTSELSGPVAPRSAEGGRVSSE